MNKCKLLLGAKMRYNPRKIYPKKGCRNWHRASKILKLAINLQSELIILRTLASCSEMISQVMAKMSKKKSAKDKTQFQKWCLKYIKIQRKSHEKKTKLKACRLMP